MSQLDIARIVFTLCAVAMVLVSFAMWSGQLFIMFGTLTAVVIYSITALSTVASVIWVIYAEAHERRYMSQLFDKTDDDDR